MNAIDYMDLEIVTDDEIVEILNGILEHKRMGKIKSKTTSSELLGIDINLNDKNDTYILLRIKNRDKKGD